MSDHHPDVWELLKLLELPESAREAARRRPPPPASGGTTAELRQRQRSEYLASIEGFLERHFPGIDADVREHVLREWGIVRSGGELWQRSTIEALGLGDALAFCLGEKLAAPWCRPVAGAGHVARNPVCVHLTPAGRGALARRRMEERGQTDKAEEAVAAVKLSNRAEEAATDWTAFRNERRPNGKLLTTAFVKSRFGISKGTLSKRAKDDPSIRRKNPDGRGHVYRYDAVQRIADEVDAHKNRGPRGPDDEEDD